MSRKIYLSIVAGLIFFVAVIWLLFRACSGGPFIEKTVFQIGRDSTWYPHDLRGREKSVVGFSNDLMNAIGKDQGFKAIVFEVGANALVDGLDLGNYDAILSSMTPNPMNRKRYVFSDPYYLIGPVLIVREDSKINSLEDMTGKILGIESGAFQVFNIMEPPDVIIIPHESAAKALENLDASVIDGVLLDALNAYVWVEGFYAGRLKVATSPITDKGLRVIALNNPAKVKWIELINAGLKKVRKDGEYDKLIQKWDLIDTEKHDKNNNQTESGSSAQAKNSNKRAP